MSEFATTVSRRSRRRLGRRLHGTARGKHHEHRAHVRLAQAARRSATASPTRSSPGSAASSPACPAPTLFLQAVQDVRIGGRDEQRPVPVHAAGHRPGRAQPPGRRSCCAKLRDAARAARRLERPAEPRPAGLARDRPRHRFAARRLAPGHRRHALRRLRPAPGLDDLTSAEPVPRRAGGRARVPAGSRRAQEHLRQRSTGAQVPLAAFARFEPRNTPLAVNHQGQFPAVTLSFNLAPGVVARRGRRRPSRPPSARSGFPPSDPRRASRAPRTRSRRRSPTSRS